MKRVPKKASTRKSAEASSSDWSLNKQLIRGIVVGFALGVVSTNAVITGPRNLKAFGVIDAACDCSKSSSPKTIPASTSTVVQEVSSSGVSISSAADIERGLIRPFERTPTTTYMPGHYTDSYTYFHNYLNKFGQKSSNPPTDFEALPLLHIWPTYFEAYHNHWQRYRGKEVVFMEIGVQSGGKIPMLRDYFGPGLTYIGIDINPSCKMFDSADWIHIEMEILAREIFWNPSFRNIQRLTFFWTMVATP